MYYQAHSDDRTHEIEEVEHGQVLYRASFGPAAIEKYISYKTWGWVLISLCMILAYGMGIFMLIYLPVMRHIWREEIKKRRLYVTSESVVFKTETPCCCPCFGSSRQEKHVMISLVTDVVLSQSWFQQKFGIFQVAVENAGQGNTDPNGRPKMDVSVVAVDDPQMLKRVILMSATYKRNGHVVNAELVSQMISGTATYPAGPGPQPVSGLGGVMTPVPAPMSSSSSSVMVAPSGNSAMAAPMASPRTDEKLDQVVIALGRVAELLQENNSILRAKQ
jgi:hypothetical protein